MGIEGKKIGRLYGVGVGPGDPELLTLRAYRVLSQVPVVFVPHKNAKSKSYAYSIIDGLVGEPPQKVVALVFPMQKDSQKLVPYWERAAEEIWWHLAQGEDCAFVNEGDPFLYGTFIHVFEIIRERYPEVTIEVIPGVSSINAASARGLLPLASGKERVAILPTTYENNIDALRETFESFDTVVLLKVHSTFDKVLDLLEDMKLTDRCVYIKRCTSPDEEIVRDIRKLRGKNLDYLSLLIVQRR